MALIDDIRRQAAREARLLDGLDRAFAQELARTLRLVNRQIRRLVGTLESQNGRLVASQAALGRALRLRVELETILATAGYPELIGAALGPSLDALTAETLRGRTIAARAARLTPIDVDVLEAWQTIRRADLLEVGDDLVTAVWRSTVDGVLGSRSVVSLTDELAALTDVTTRQARTVYDTAISTYSRQVDQLGMTPSPDDRFVYVGPSDTQVRPFCRQWLGEVRTRSQLDEISNGQLPNTLLTGGGWNCRHKWFFLANLDVGEIAA